MLLYSLTPEEGCCVFVKLLLFFSLFKKRKTSKRSYGERAGSLAGRASRLHREGREFESLPVHQWSLVFGPWFFAQKFSGKDQRLTTNSYFSSLTSEEKASFVQIFNFWRMNCVFIKLLIMPTMDALEVLTEEGRIWRRYSSGRCHKPVIRRFPNGATQSSLATTSL